MGNITSLSRDGWQNTSNYTNMDNLVYTYDSGNKLQKILDNGNDNYGFKDGVDQTIEYTYDANGNMVSDANKGITGIEYNHLNMPTEIKFNNSDTQKINYTYTADGIKLRKVTVDESNTTTTDYADNFVYENNTLKQFYHEEGYVEPDGSGSFDYVYQYSDIWGNTRLTYADDNDDGSVDSSEIRREQNYYPLGMEHKGYNSVLVGAKNNLKTYQGQEFIDDLGLNMHEWKYRMSDPAIGRFWQVDPLAEDYLYNSTYAFAENKLGMGIELEGAEIYTWLQQKIVGDAVQNPNGVGAHTLGVAQGLANTATGVVDAISNPVQTLKGAGNAALWLAVGSQFSEQVDGALGTNSTGAGDGILNSVVEGGDNLINGNGIERGTVIGEIAGAVVGTKGTNAALKTVAKSSKVGVIYERLDNAGGLKPYVGQAKSESRFLARQKEHARANPDSDFDFKVIDRGSPNGKFPTDLDIREQRALNSRRGPTNKSNPNGGTSNKKNVVKKYGQ
jgi:RHS repeat-associated protein